MLIATAINITRLLAWSGGQEFLAVLPGCDLPKACIVAERIRTRVAAHWFAGQAGLHVTVQLEGLPPLFPPRVTEAVRFSSIAARPLC